MFEEIASLLRRRWLPEQIAGRRKRIEDGEVQQSGLQVGHEAIYEALYAPPRGELRRELIACLRQDKSMRDCKPKGAERRGKLCNMTNIRERPEDVEGRLVPGHWERDLIIGARRASAIPSVRWLSQHALPAAGGDAELQGRILASASADALNAIPALLRQTLTYDQGKEMAKHEDLAEATGMKIFLPTRARPGSATAMRTPTACCGSNFPRHVAVQAGPR